MKRNILVLILLCLVANFSYSAEITKPLNTSTWNFEQNLGQVKGKDGSKVKFFLSRNNLKMFLMTNGWSYQIEQKIFPKGYESLSKTATIEEKSKMAELAKQIKTETHRIDMVLIGANPNPIIIAEDQSVDYINYYNHQVLNVRAFNKVIYKDIYPNIDWVVYTKENGETKYDFIVHAGGDPSLIKIKPIWSDKVSIDPLGQVNLESKLGKIIEQKPISFQENIIVESKYTLNDGVIGFDFGFVNSQSDLIIDPTLAWSTYYGGTGVEESNFIQVDKAGDVYVCGNTTSTTVIASGGYQSAIGGLSDAFLVKFTPSGARLWATYYGGAGDDKANGIGVDKSNNVFISGATNSSANIATAGSYQSSLSGGNDAFLTKFSSTGSLVWSTYIGGTSIDESLACVADDSVSSNIYIVGTTQSTSGISTLSSHQVTYNSGTDAFISKFNNQGNLIWSTYYGGAGSDQLNSVVIDKTNKLYASGSTASNSNIASGGYQNTFATVNLNDAFLVKFNSQGTRQWATYYGDSLNDGAYGCAIDKSNNVYMSGFTFSVKNIASPSGVFQSTHGGGTDFMIVKFDSLGNRLYATYFGNSGLENGFSCTTDSFNNLYIVGHTTSSTGMASSGIQSTYGGGLYDVLIAMFDSTGARKWSSYYGSTGKETFPHICSDASKNVYITGFTTSTTGMTTAGAFQTTYNGTTASTEIFVSKIVSEILPTISITKTGSDSVCTNKSLLFSSFITFGGTTPSYKWYRNGVIVATTATYLGSNFTSKDTIKCLLKSNDPLVTTDSAWSNTIIIVGKMTSTNTINQSICSNKSYFFKGQNRKLAGVYYDTLTNAVGCDSFVTLNLTVKDTSATLLTVSNCVTYTFKGIPRMSSGVYKDTLVNSLGCDSIVTLNLTIKNPSTKAINQTICSNKFYFFKGQNRTTAGVYKDTLINAVGCDSFVTLNLSVNSTSSKVINQTICSNKFYFFKGQNRTTAGVYLDTILNGNSLGCDSFVTLNLTVNPISTKALNITTCRNSPYFFKGQNRSATGVYKDTLVNSIGCDSIVTLNLTVNDTSSRIFTQTICSNKFYFFKGQNRNIAGTYRDTILNVAGCDSFITLYLVVKPISTKIIDTTICLNHPYFFKGQLRSFTGTYRDTLINSIGCDSFVTLNLIVRPTNYKFVNSSVCTNSSYFFNGQYLTTAGTYLDTLTNVFGCDSFISLNLTVKNSVSNSISVTTCSISPYFFKGQFRSTSGVYIDTIPNSVGCDSIVTLNLTVITTISKRIDTSVCSSRPIFFKSKYQTVTGTYIDTQMSVLGCDSFTTLNLIVNKSDTTILFDSTKCGQTYLFQGNPITSSGVYTAVLRNQFSCDSTVILNYYHRVQTISIDTQNICFGQSYFFNGVNQFVSGNYRDTLVNSKGCDSFIFLRLNVNFPSFPPVKRDTFCSNVGITISGKTYYTAGTIRDTLFNVKGCDSIVTHILVKKDTSFLKINREICDGFFYDFYGTKLYTSGNYKHTLINKKGCDSFVYLTLKVNPSPVQQVYDTICDGQSYIFGTNVYYTAGIFTQNLLTSKGCDSTITLHLYQKKNSYYRYYNAYCSNQPRYFNGQLLTASGVYLDTLVNKVGCDSFITLYFKYIPTSSSILNVNICPETQYYFNGAWLNSAGIYKDTIMNNAGCDSFITLNLGIFPSNSISITKSNDTLIASSGFPSYKWFINGTAISWANLIYYKTANIVGNYNAVGIDTNKCYFKSNVISIAKSQIVDIGNLDWSIYPVPTSDRLFIQSEWFKSKHVRINILSIDGKTVISQETVTYENEQSIDVSALSKGVYFVELNDGQKTVNKKFNIE